jgi:hypothetical protein
MASYDQTIFTGTTATTTVNGHHRSEGEGQGRRTWRRDNNDGRGSIRYVFFYFFSFCWFSVTHPSRLYLNNVCNCDWLIRNSKNDEIVTMLSVLKKKLIEIS